MASRLDFLAEAIEENGKEIISLTLTYTSGRITEAAQILDVSRKGLWEKMKTYGINANDYVPVSRDRRRYG